METKVNLNQKRLLLVIITSVVFVLVVSSFIILFFLGLFDNFKFLTVIYAVVLPFFGSAVAISVMSYLSYKATLENLRKENLFKIGVENHFFNYPLFSKRVARLRRNRRHPVYGHIVCFNVVPLKNVALYTPSEKTLNSHITVVLGDLLRFDPSFAKELNAYCLYKECFVIFSAMSLEKIHDLIDAIHKDVYKYISEKELKVFAQPHFGISEIFQETDLTAAVENAFTARDIASRNFEEITFFKEEFNQITDQKQIDEIQKAIEDKELVVYYQPKFSLRKKAFIGSEALVRWNSPTKGLILPGKFIKLAEVGGLIHQIDLYVFKHVIDDLQEMKRNGNRLLPVSINFSLYEFFSPTFISDLFKMIDSSMLPPELIEIEITETTSQANMFMATSILKKIKEHGMRVLMDDFGTGFSNLLNLNTLPIDVVKIDKSFVDGLISNNKNRDIVKLLISICKANKLEVIAEGVDAKEEVNILEKANCDVIQGFYYSEPIPCKDYLNFLKDNPFEKKGDKKQ